jgi:hypothetical protein
MISAPILSVTFIGLAGFIKLIPVILIIGLVVACLAYSIVQFKAQNIKMGLIGALISVFAMSISFTMFPFVLSVLNSM